MGCGQSIEGKFLRSFEKFKGKKRKFLVPESRHGRNYLTFIDNMCEVEVYYGNLDEKSQNKYQPLIDDISKWKSLENDTQNLEYSTYLFEEYTVSSPGYPN